MSEMKTHHTAVVLIPPLEVWEPIQAIRRRYDRQFKRWMPHITLLYPFRPAERFDEVRPAIEACCAATGPFDVDLRDLRHFEHSRSNITMWLAPEPPEPIVRLQASLLACTPDCNEVNLHASGFLPHLSIGQAHSPAEFEERVTRIQSRLPPIRFVAGEIALIRRGPGHTDPFEVDRLIPFGSHDKKGLGGCIPSSS